MVDITYKDGAVFCKNCEHFCRDVETEREEDCSECRGIHDYERRKHRCPECGAIHRGKKGEGG